VTALGEVEAAINLGAVAAGLVAGSFIGVVVHRSGEASILRPARSRCPHCGVTLTARDLVPLFSWALAGGRCRRCGDGLGWFYPGVELAAAAIALWSALTLTGWAMVVACLLGWTLLTIALIDVRRLIVPDTLSLPLVAVGLGVAFAGDAGPADALLSACIGYATFAFVGWAYERVRGMPGLGLGDAKLLGAAGAWVGWQGLPSVVLIGALAGLAGVLVAGGADRNRRIPFAPSLCFGFWIVWLYGPMAVGGVA